MSDDRLSGLCMLSLHREKIEKEGQRAFAKKVVDHFAICVRLDACRSHLQTPSDCKDVSSMYEISVILPRNIV